MAKRIVIVEDDRAFRNVMAAALKGRGYEVISVGDGEKGEQLVRSVRPDLVILDVVLPRKNGLDISQDLRKDATYSSVRILMTTCLTEMSEKDDRYWREQTGADDFLTKPFPVGELIRRVAALIGPA